MAGDAPGESDAPVTPEPKATEGGDGRRENLESPSPATAEVTPRGAAIASMYEHAGRLAASGDLAGARALHAAIGAMLGSDDAGGSVIDLQTRRGR